MILYCLDVRGTRLVGNPALRNDHHVFHLTNLERIQDKAAHYHRYGFDVYTWVHYTIELPWNTVFTGCPDDGQA